MKGGSECFEGYPHPASQAGVFFAKRHFNTLWRCARFRSTLGMFLALVLFSVLLGESAASSSPRMVYTDAAGQIRQVDAWGDDSLRVRVAPPGAKIIQLPPAQGLLPDPPRQRSSSGQTSATKFVNGNIQLEINERGLATISTTREGRVLLQETDVHFACKHPKGCETPAASITFHGLSDNEWIYGLGQARGSDRCDNQCTGKTLPIQNWTWRIEDTIKYSWPPFNNGNAWVPFYQSSRGYGFLWNMASFGLVELNKARLHWFSNATAQIDYFITTVPVAHDLAKPPYQPLMRNFARASGMPPQIPMAYTGFWQCKLRYSSQSQVLRIAREYIKRQVPISVIVIDYMHWVHNGDWRFSDDPAVVNHTSGCWPEPAAMVSELQDLGILTAVSVWPDVEPGSLNWKPMTARQLLVRGKDGAPATTSTKRHMLDAFNREAREYVWRQLMLGYGRYGIETFWLDATEPEGGVPGEFYFKMDDGVVRRDLEVGMAWVQHMQKMVREGLQTRHPPPAPVPPFLSRSAFVGSQRYGAILWSGDIASSFNELAVQVQVAQHVAMSGIYLWTTDIGGFRGGNTEDPVMRELIVRWFQFGAFCPIFRLHGNRDGPQDPDACGSFAHNEVWSYGEVAFAAIVAAMRLRERLRPYVQRHLQIASLDGTPLLRPMCFDFRAPDCAAAPDQYMFGPRFLVAPVTVYRAQNRSVWIPPLADSPGVWVAFYTREEVPWGWITVPTHNISEFPLFECVGAPEGDDGVMDTVLVS